MSKKKKNSILIDKKQTIVFHSVEVEEKIVSNDSKAPQSGEVLGFTLLDDYGDDEHDSSLYYIFKLKMNFVFELFCR